MPVLSDYEPPFARSEYRRRVKDVRERMADAGLDVLLVTNPANINYLTGFDTWSFYVYQHLIVPPEGDPIYVGRNMEEAAAHNTTHLPPENVRVYGKEYGPGGVEHPTAFVADILAELGVENGIVGVEMGSEYFTAEIYERLQANVPGTLRDATNLVNRAYLVKTDAELEFVREAARVTDRAMRAAREVIEDGGREADAAAEIQRTLIQGTEDHGGEQPAHPSAFGPVHHLWNPDRRFQEGDLFSVELSGCIKRYHAPLCRVFHVGDPPERYREMHDELDQSLGVILDAIEPGRTCEEVDRIYRENAIHVKDARSGYAAGLGYPPSWGEHTASLQQGNDLELQEGMVFHSTPSIDDIGPGYRMLLSEAYVVTDDGAEPLSAFPRELQVV